MLKSQMLSCVLLLVAKSVVIVQIRILSMF